MSHVEGLAKMSAYMRGYRDGFSVAKLENAEEVYASQCDALELELARLVTTIYRRRPAQCKREMQEYVTKSQYLAGFCDGYNRARREKSAGNQ